mgnify:CR=1 FL=1
MQEFSSSSSSCLGFSGSKSLSIINDLNFAASNVGIINTRDNDQRIIIRDDTTTISRLGEGHVDGIIQRPFGTGAGSFKFEIGAGNDYTPMTLDLSTGGSGGDIQAIAFSPVTVNGGNRIDSVRKVNYWWQAIKTDTTTIGTDLNVKLQFPASEMANINQNDAWLRHFALPMQSPAWGQVPGTNLTWNTSEASALITNPADYFDELGNFYIGEKSLITFYSRQDGPWTDPNTWTLDPSHIGAPLSAGEFPNPSPSDTLDNVYVGLNHIVALDTAISKVDSLIVRNDSKLDMLTNIIECAGCTAAGKGLFDLRDNATIAFANTSQPSSTTTLISFTDYVVSPLSTIEFYGTQNLTDTPFGFLTYPNNVLVSGVGTKTVSVPLIIEGNLTVETPALLNINADALSVYQNVINSGTINNQQILEIGQ